jgi:hypothetical protein
VSAIEATREATNADLLTKAAHRGAPLTAWLDTAAGWRALAHHTTELPGTEPEG